MEQGCLGPKHNAFLVVNKLSWSRQFSPKHKPCWDVINSHGARQFSPKALCLHGLGHKFIMDKGSLSEAYALAGVDVLL
jgi:hypothetical protein